MGRARTREPRNDDRPIDYLVMDRGVLLQRILDQQPVGRIADGISEQSGPGEIGEVCVGIPLAEQQVQPLAEIIGAKIRQSGPVPRRAKHGILGQGYRIGIAICERSNLRWRQLGVEKIVDRNVVGHRHFSRKSSGAISAATIMASRSAVKEWILASSRASEASSTRE